MARLTLREATDRKSPVRAGTGIAAQMAAAVLGELGVIERRRVQLARIRVGLLFDRPGTQLAEGA